MNVLLWIVQAVLAIKLVSVSYTHAFRRSLPTMQEAIKRLGKSSRPVLALVAIFTFLAAVGLILPGVLGVFPRITPVTAGILSILLVASLFFHLVSREKPKIFVSIVLFALAAFVAWGRWTLFP
ncbi:MAG: DoxX family protein [Anaerolineales bacterium]